jgi:uncharacterized protein (TIGR00369 family)
MLAMSQVELLAFLAAAFPRLETKAFSIDRLTDQELVLRLATNEEHLRPGGTISGPTLMMVADTATYLLLISQIGPVALAVTTNLNINFLRKPTMGELVGRATMLKRGKRLATAQVELTTGTQTELVAHATVSYSIP